MTSDIYELKEAIEEASTGAGGDGPWEVFGQIRLETGVSLATINEDDTVSQSEYEEVREAAEEVTGESFSEYEYKGIKSMFNA